MILTRSPLRITLGDDFQSLNVKGLYPAGEGASYAGGILSAGVDGIEVAEAVALSAVSHGKVITCRSVANGWHHETLWVYNLLVPPEVKPINQDGEVSEFACLSPKQVVEAIASDAFTVDAACVIAQGVLN